MRFSRRGNNEDCRALLRSNATYSLIDCAGEIGAQKAAHQAMPRRHPPACSATAYIYAGLISAAASISPPIAPAVSAYEALIVARQFLTPLTARHLASKTSARSAGASG